MTRNQMIELLADWFAWNFTTYSKDWDSACLHIGAYYSEVIDAMQASWVHTHGGSAEVLDLALDVVIHPPDLSGRSHWKTADFDAVEFTISNQYFIWKWFQPFSSLWFEAMTPLLHNQVTLSPNSIYATSRELVLRNIGSECQSEWTRLEPGRRDALFDWLEPLTDQWKEFTKAEQQAFWDALSWLYAEPTPRGRQFLVNLRVIVDPLDTAFIDHLLTKPI